MFIFMTLKLCLVEINLINWYCQELSVELNQLLDKIFGYLVDSELYLVHKKIILWLLVPTDNMKLVEIRKISNNINP